jgi:2-dehydro-3-deoxyphosphogluconate aldolase/(4S)-4-hydroxy-2-oxoglutarate aldolase
MEPTSGVNLNNISEWQKNGAAIFGIAGHLSSLANQEKFDGLEKVAAEYLKQYSDLERCKQ